MTDLSYPSIPRFERHHRQQTQISEVVIPQGPKWGHVDGKQTTIFWTSAYEYSKISWLFDPKWLKGRDLQGPMKTLQTFFAFIEQCIPLLLSDVSLLKMCMNCFQWWFKMNHMWYRLWVLQNQDRVGVVWGKPARPPATSKNPSLSDMKKNRSGQKYLLSYWSFTSVATVSRTPQVSSSIAMGATHDVSEDEGGKP